MTTAAEQQPATWLVVFGEIEGFRWVTENQKMAFSAGKCSRARRIRREDRLIFYMARGAYHNPTRDRSQLMGIATVEGDVNPLSRTVLIQGKQFTCGCPLRIEHILPERRGVPFDDRFVQRLRFIKRKEVWGQYLRSGLVHLDGRDAAVLYRAVLDRGS